jgi:acetylornithine deacetylase/succinyl-diaminopimelate desuccinylase-like protein
VTPAIDERALRDEATALLRELLRVDTSNPPGGETAAALVLQRHLEAAGVACELVARDPARANLVARIPGSGGGPSLAFLAHTDVVPVDDAAAWTHPPFGGHVDDGYIWGRGAADMKNEDERIARAAALPPMLPELVEPLFAMTIAPTRLHGSRALNVMPSEAAVECDCRPVPGMTLEEVEGELRAALGDDLPYALTFSGDPVGGTISPLETPLYEACRAWVAENDPEAILVPTLTNGFTDSHYMREAFGTVAYGFWPIRHTPTAVLHGGVHARDERIHIDDLGYATRFHIEVAMAINNL